MEMIDGEESKDARQPRSAEASNNLQKTREKKNK
jgi:hypothetical protein